VAVSEEEVRSLVGHRFPSGTVSIEHWENVLLSDTTGSAPPGAGLVHPAALFHAPLAGVGLRIADLFALFRAESDEAVRAGEYLWELHRPLRENVAYRASGEVVSVERKQSRSLGTMDVVGYRIDLHDPDDGSLVASTTSSWLVLRSG